MTALVVTTTATVTVYAAARALDQHRAVLIERPAADRHTEQARTAETRPEKP